MWIQIYNLISFNFMKRNIRKLVALAAMISLNWDLLVGSPVFFSCFAVSSLSTFAIYFKTSFSDPGTVRT